MAATGDETVGHESDPLVLPVSFDAFFERERLAALRLAVVLTGQRSVAEELVQDAFVAALARWAVVSTYEHPELWLRRALINLCTSSWRRRAVEARGLTLLRGRRGGETPGDLTGHEVWDAIRRLPRRQRQVMALYAVEDLPLRTIAELLECSEETARTHMRRGRAALASALRETEGDDDAR